MSCLPQPRSQRSVRSDSDAPLSTLCADLIGPITPSSFGKNYILNVVDTASPTAIFSIPIASKCDATAELIALIQKLALSFPTNVINVLRTDNGTEFSNHQLKSFCRDWLIDHQFAIPSVHVGKIERFNRTLVTAARCCLLSAKISKKFWSYAVKFCSYVMNRSASDNVLSAFENLTGNSPIHDGTLDPRLYFGVPVLYRIEVTRSAKFNARTAQGFFLGYDSPRQKGIHVLTLKGSVITTRDFSIGLGLLII